MAQEVDVDALKAALKPEESRFSGEGADLVLLHWLRHAEQAIEGLTSEDLLPSIQPLHAFFLKLLVPSTSPALPKPGRPTRNLITRCMVTLHRKVESRSLFDFVQALVKAVGDNNGGGKNMSPAENVARVACWNTIGEIIKHHGANMMSFMAEICTVAMKVLRNTNLSVILRYHAVLAFSRSLHSAGKALPDALFKDLLKQLRNGLADKALPIQRVCAETFIALHSYTAACPLKETIETLLPLILKSLETADYSTRRSFSRLVAHLLAASQAPGSGFVAPEPPKKGAKKEEGDGLSEPTVVTSAAEDRGSKTLFSADEMLKLLSVPYNRPQTSRRVRNALFDTYATLFSALGATYVEAQYAAIIRHLMEEIVAHQRWQTNRYEVLAAREAVTVLVRDLIGTRLLSEAGQIMAIREWANSFLKKWSPTPLPGAAKINKNALIIALNDVGGLLEQLGNAPPSIIELLGEPFVRLLAHDSYSVRVAASYALRRFCAVNPSQLPKLTNVLLADLNKDLSTLGTPTAPKDVSARLTGKALGLSALIAASQLHPLYVSPDLSTKVLDLAVSLLKKSGDHDIPSAVIHVQVAWHLVAALMSLGPGFVKQHLPQLLILWRNALPKPTSKDTAVGERGEAEWSFLLLVRECALTAVLDFLRHDSSLVNIDVARRLATLLTNTLNFVNGFATAYAEALREQVASQDGSKPQSSLSTLRPSLVERESNLRRRVLQCFTALGSSSATETMQSALLQAAITVFADPENYSGSAAQAAIAAQAGAFTGIWNATDGYAFGVTSLMGQQGQREAESESEALNRDSIELAIDAQLTHPIIGSMEHDPLAILPSAHLAGPPKPAPPQTGVIDAGVELFATIFPHQSVEGQVQSLATLQSHVRSSKLEKNPGRKQAVLANTIVALKRALVVTDGVGVKARRSLGNAQVTDLLKGLLQDAILDPSPRVRQSSADSMGLLASLAGSQYLSQQIQWLVDQVVNNRVPEARAGCAVAFGSIYASVGGMSGGPILKTIVNILMSLATDPHPVVHFYAMQALGHVINAANLSYEPWIPNTLGMVSNIYLLDSHEPEGGSLGSVNLRGDLPAYQVICQILHALIGVIGPELQEPGKIRSLVFLLVHEFGEETDEGLAVEAIKCVQQFLMFAPGEVDVPALLRTFRSHLASQRRPLKVAAITALYQIVQRDAVLISKLGGNQLVEDLFGLLDNDPSLDGVRNVISSWLSQTAAALPSGWIDLCQRIMSRSSPSSGSRQTQLPKQQAQHVFMDDEGESLGAESTSSTSGLSSRWRTQLFALQCLHQIVLAVFDSGRQEHFDPALSRRLGQGNKSMLWSRVADLVRMAFSASAAMVMDVRLAGLIVLRDVIERFSHSADPDFEGSLLLEQHQAPIAAALTPSFGSDSAPEVLASAVQVCAVFVGSGVIKEVGRMGRILKLLTGALEGCRGRLFISRRERSLTHVDGQSFTFGDVEDLSPNAAVMLKVSVLTAWAELEVASVRQAYLTEVIKPYRWLLGPFWVGALRDYAALRTDPDMASGSLSGVGGLGMGEGLGKEVLLPYYESAIPKILEAFSMSLLSEDGYTLSSLQGQAVTSSSPPPAAPKGVPAEPNPSFYIIYGLAFEALVRSMGDTATAAFAQVCLRTMQGMIRPQISGNVFEGALFDELCTVCYRIGMGEGAASRAEMCEVVRSFVVSRKGVVTSDEQQIRRCLAIITYALRHAIATPETPSSFSYTDSAQDRVLFFRAAFSAYASIVASLDATQRADLFAVALHLISDLLKEETAVSSGDVAGGCLPILKSLLDQLLAATTQVPGSSAPPETVVHGLLSSCLANIEEMRTRVTPVASLKIKNNLLAATLILTSLPANVKISRDLVEQVAYDIGQNLSAGQDRPELGLTAVGCASTLLAASIRPQLSTLANIPPTPSPILQHCTLHLLPPLISYVADSVVSFASAPSGDSASSSALLVDGVKEVIKGLVQWSQGMSDSVRPRAYAALLPTLCLLLDPDAEHGHGQGQSTSTHAIATSTMLRLAQESPAAFRDATARMEPGERGRLERAVRDAVGGQDNWKQQVAKEERKGIELRSFG